MGYFNNREIMGIALLRAGSCAARDGVENLKGKFVDLGLYDKLTEALDAIDNAEGIALSTCEDEDARIGIERRIRTYKVGLSHVKPECKELHVVHEGDMQTLLGHSLNYCDMECPCVVVREDGSREVIKAAVKACEMRKMYKRLLLSEGMSAECPYSTMV